MGYEHILVKRSGDFATVTMNRPQRRNALSLAHMRELIAAFEDLGNGDALGIVLAGNGPVFSAGHDFADVADADLLGVRSLLMTCTELMTLIQQVPQPVVARVHGLATAAGCQLVASADLAVASDQAGFAAPGWTGGWSTGWCPRRSSTPPWTTCWTGSPADRPTARASASRHCTRRSTWTRPRPTATLSKSWPRPASSR